MHAMRMYAVTGISADSSAVRSAVIAPEIFPWYRIQRFSSRFSMRPLLSTERAQQAVVAGAVDLDPVAVGRLGIEGRPHDAGDLVLAADDPDVADGRARQAHHGRQLVEERREERRPGVGHTRDDATGRQVHELEDVVGILEPPPLALNRGRREDLGAAADHSVVGRAVALPHAPDTTGHRADGLGCAILS